MGLSLKRLEDQVMVITGASSGIGLTTARMAAKRGARLVLAARNEAALRELCEEIRREGGQATYVAADVGDEAAVQSIAREAVRAYGGFDTWVNNAGISVYGRMLDVPTEDNRRVFETNYWGLVYGSLEAARHLRQRGDGYAGAIINIGSEVSDRAIPLQGMYSASKHAVHGFTDALRMELEKDGAPVMVTLIKPSAINTPFPQHARSYMAEEPKLPEPTYAPEVVAEAILHCAEVPQREFYAGSLGKMHAVQGAVAPRLTDWIMEMFHFDTQKEERPNDRRDTLEAPAATAELRQRGPAQQTMEYSAYDWLEMRPMLTAAVLTGVGLAAASLVASAWARGGRGGRRN